MYFRGIARFEKRLIERTRRNCIYFSSNFTCFTCAAGILEVVSLEGPSGYMVRLYTYGFGYLLSSLLILVGYFQPSTETLTEPVVESIETGETIETPVTRQAGCFYSGRFSRSRKL